MRHPISYLIVAGAALVITYLPFRHGTPMNVLDIVTLGLFFTWIIATETGYATMTITGPWRVVLIDHEFNDRVFDTSAGHFTRRAAQKEADYYSAIAEVMDRNYTYRVERTRPRQRRQRGVA